MTNQTSAAVIRRATTEDAAVLAQMGAATFAETFGHLYPPEDLREFLATSYTSQKYGAQLADPAMGIWLALVADEAAGFIVAGSCKLPVPDLESRAGEVQQLYVYAKYQNMQIGSRLLDLALQWLGEQRRAPLYVGVWCENFGAQRLYGRQGFVKCGEYGFPVGNTVDLEFILRRGP